MEWVKKRCSPLEKSYQKYWLKCTLFPSRTLKCKEYVLVFILQVTLTLAEIHYLHAATSVLSEIGSRRPNSFGRELILTISMY